MTSKEIAERWFTPAYVGGFKGLVTDLDRLGFIADIDAYAAEVEKATAERCLVLIHNRTMSGAIEAIRREFKLGGA